MTIKVLLYDVVSDSEARAVEKKITAWVCPDVIEYQGKLYVPWSVSEEAYISAYSVKIEEE